MNNQGEAQGEMMVLNQGDQKIRKKLANFFKKYPQKVAKSKKPKYLHKAQFESPKHPQQPNFETLKYLKQTMLYVTTH
jgi:hypothetical protein